MVRKSVDFRGELKDIIKAAGRKAASTKTRDITGALRLEDRFFRRLYTHRPMNSPVIKDAGQEINLFIKRYQLPNKWKSLPNDVLLDKVKTTTHAMRLKGKKLKTLGMKRMDFALVLKGEHMITRANRLANQRTQLKKSLRHYKSEIEKLRKDMAFGGIRRTIKEKTKRGFDNLLKERVREVYILDDLIQNNKREARKYHKEIVSISKEMQKEISRPNPSIEHFINLGRQRLAYLGGYNAKANELNRRIEKIVGNQSYRRTKNFMKGFFNKTSNNSRDLRTILGDKEYKRLEKLAQKPWIKVPNMFIPKKYEFTLMAQ